MRDLEGKEKKEIRRMIKMYLVLGVEPFNYAEIKGIHQNIKIALSQLQDLNKNKPPLCVQRYEVVTTTEAKRRHYSLYT